LVGGGGLASATAVAGEPNEIVACPSGARAEPRCPPPPIAGRAAAPVAPASVPHIVLPKGAPSLPPCHGCGCKGGPGYRGPNGRCVAWRELARICGPSLPGRCAAEEVDPRAEDIAAGRAPIAAKPKRRRSLPIEASRRSPPSGLRLRRRARTGGGRPVGP
jgi:hypothetical protein